MDGVISDFSREHKILEEKQGCAIHRPDLHVDYGNLQAMPGAKDALMKLDNDFEIYIASTPPWSRPDMWAAKRRWIESHFPYLKRKANPVPEMNRIANGRRKICIRWKGNPRFEHEQFRSIPVEKMLGL